jgi:hypothetical protein
MRVCVLLLLQSSSLMTYARLVAHMHSAEDRRGNDEWLASRVRVLEEYCASLEAAMHAASDMRRFKASNTRKRHDLRFQVSLQAVFSRASMDGIAKPRLGCSVVLSWIAAFVTVLFVFVTALLLLLVTGNKFTRGSHGRPNARHVEHEHYISHGVSRRSRGSHNEVHGTMRPRCGKTSVSRSFFDPSGASVCWKISYRRACRVEDLAVLQRGYQHCQRRGDARAVEA